jgi:hypothetical protein
VGREAQSFPPMVVCTGKISGNRIEERELSHYELSFMLGDMLHVHLLYIFFLNQPLNL